ncbi:hypothetical protein WJ63_15145 [Burkholderia pyrrocinia]|nr:hypothetical protein WJ63_15145 [Burkholderia pyrrocinia]WGS44514.1 hypothetical protein LFL97_28395 [Burkholderia sp. JSH-S8]
MSEADPDAVQSTSTPWSRYLRENIDRADAMLASGEVHILDNTVTVPLKTIFDSAPAGADDIIVLSGTLIEGIGTIHSDFDVCVVSDRSVQTAQFDVKHHNWVLTDKLAQAADSVATVRQVHNYLGADGLHIDAEYFSRAEIDHLFERVDQYYQRALSGTRVIRDHLAAPELRFLHRLYTGVPVQSGRGYAALMTQTHKAHLCYVLYRFLASEYGELKDVMGAWHAGKFDMAYEQMREILIAHLRGITHLSGSTNFNRKWLYALTARLTGAARDAVERARRLLFQGAPTDDARRAFVLDACDALDDLFTEIRRLLRDEPLFVGGARGIALTYEEYRKRTIPGHQLDLEFAHRLKQFSEHQAPTRMFIEHPEAVRLRWE